MTVYQVLQLVTGDHETITYFAGMYTTLDEANKHVDWLYKKAVKDVTGYYGDTAKADVEIDEEYDGRLIFSYMLFGIRHEVHICKGELKDHFEPES